MKLACPPATSSTRVCGGHFRTKIASLITNMTSTKRRWTSKHKSRSKPQVHLWPICLHMSTQRRSNVWRTERENRKRFPYLAGEAARRKLHAETNLLLPSRLGTHEYSCINVYRYDYNLVPQLYFIVCIIYVRMWPKQNLNVIRKVNVIK